MEQGRAVPKDFFKELGNVPQLLVVQYMDDECKAVFACSSKQCNWIVRQSVKTLTFKDSAALDTASRFLAGRPHVLAERFPFCDSLSITLQCTQDAAEHTPVILTAAACYKPPLESLKLVAEEPRSTDTLQQASLLLLSLQSLEISEWQYTVPTFQALGQFTSLTKLVLGPDHGNPGDLETGTLSQLSTLKGLKELTIKPYLGSSYSPPDLAQQFSIDFVAALPNLTSLSLRTSADLEPLALCSNLKSLHVSKVTSWWAGEAPPPEISYEFLSSLTQLTQLSISACGSLAPLTSCSSLADLGISDLHLTKGTEVLGTLAAALTHLTPSLTSMCR